MRNLFGIFGLLLGSSVFASQPNHDDDQAPYYREVTSICYTWQAYDANLIQYNIDGESKYRYQISWSKRETARLFYDGEFVEEITSNLPQEPVAIVSTFRNGVTEQAQVWAARKEFHRCDN